MPAPARAREERKKVHDGVCVLWSCVGLNRVVASGGGLAGCWVFHCAGCWVSIVRRCRDGCCGVSLGGCGAERCSSLEARVAVRRLG